MTYIKGFSSQCSYNWQIISNLRLKKRNVIVLKASKEIKIVDIKLLQTFLC